MRTNFLYTICFLLMTGIGFSETDALYILHSNNTNGALENCYCPDHPLGSMEKRVGYVETFLNAHPNTVILDAGDLFSPVYRPAKDSLIAEAYKLIPYDAILPGDQELTRGELYLGHFLMNTQADIVLSNYSSEWLRHSVSEKIIQRGNKKIGIIGIINKNIFRYYPKEVQESIDVSDPVSTVKSYVKKLRKKVDVLIVLTHQGFEDDKKLAEAVSGIDVIIGSHSQTVLTSPEVKNKTLITQTGKNGYYMGVVKVVFDSNKGIVSKKGWLEAMTLDMPDNPTVMKFIQEYEEKSGLVNRAKTKYLNKH